MVLTPARTRRHRSVDNRSFLLAAARFISAAGNRVADGDVDELRDLFALREHVDEAILEAIRGLRDTGVTWEEIGQVSGTTRQAALMRWGPRL
jgi:hypothetical protein